MDFTDVPRASIDLAPSRISWCARSRGGASSRRDCRAYGYDLRLAPDGFRVFSPITSAEIDPKNFDESSLIEAPLRDAADGSRYWLLPPHSYALGVTVETFNMPAQCDRLLFGKKAHSRVQVLSSTPRLWNRAGAGVWCLNFPTLPICRCASMLTKGSRRSRFLNLMKSAKSLTPIAWANIRIR